MRRLRVVAPTLVATLLATTLAAQEPPLEALAPERLRRDPDDRGAGIRFGDTLVIGGRFSAAFDDLRNSRLDTDDAARHSEFDSGAQLQASWKPSRGLEAYAKVAALQDATRSGVPASWAAQGDMRVYEAFLLARRVAGSPIDVQIGRQRIRDAREWFYDEYVDGARVRVTVEGWRVEGLIARSLFAGTEAARARHDKQHVVLSAARRVGRHARVEGFIVARNDRSTRNEDPMWIGGSLVSTGSSATRFWYTTAARRGHSTRATLRGWAIDAGVSRRVAARFAPVFTVGYAYASGDSHSGDSTDGTFRQTGLEDNEGRLGGSRVFAYYGILFEPELSNVQILTAAAALRPKRRTSLDVIYHHYAQVTPSATVTENPLRRRASGRARHLGDEWDAIVSYRLRPWMDLNFTAAAFRIGGAFADTGSIAFEWRPQIRIYF